MIYMIRIIANKIFMKWGQLAEELGGVFEK